MTIQQDTQEQDPVPQEETENISSPIPGDENTSDDATGQQQDSSADEIIRLQAALARSQADYQNLLMRVERDRADMVHFLSAKILAPLLTQVDNLERAIAIKDGIEGDAFIDGVRALHTGLLRYLENQGVRPFDSVGQEVDPDKHYVMTEMPGEQGKIISEFEKGYMLASRVLRHAKVVVGSINS